MITLDDLIIPVIVQINVTYAAHVQRHEAFLSGTNLWHVGKSSSPLETLAAIESINSYKIFYLQANAGINIRSSVRYNGDTYNAVDVSQYSEELIKVVTEKSGVKSRLP